MEFWKNKKFETFKGEYKYLTDFTQEELIYEKVKCATDSIHVIQTYFYIFDQTKNNNKGEIVPFILFPFQKDLIKSYEENRFNITNKYRQAGISTVTCAWLASYIAFNSNRSVAIVANKLETARDELMKDVTDFIDMLPPFLHPKISGKDAANHKRYLNGSQVKAFATNSLRGYTPTFLFWDEAAWCDNGETFWTGTLPTLSTGGNAALVSCVVGDTMVWTNKGLERVEEKIESGKLRGYNVKKYSVLGKDKLREGSIMFNNGFSKTRIIKNEYTDIECTITHKLWAYSNLNGRVDYFKSSLLKKGDLLALQYGNGIFGNLDEIKYIPKQQISFDYFHYKINDAIVDVIAIFLLKGKLLKSVRPKIYDQHTVIFENLTEEEYDIVDKFIYTFSDEINSHHICKGLYLDPEKGNITSNIQSFNNVLFNMGLYYTEKYDKFTNRTLPKIIRIFKKEHLVRLIKKWVYFYENKEIIKNGFIINHKSMILMKEFQQILLNYGILSELRKISVNDKIGSIASYNLIIKCDYEKFISDQDYKPEYNQNMPMGIVEKINNVLIKYGVELPFNQYNRTYLLNIISKLDDVLSEEDKQGLSKYISPNIFWTEIIDIKSNKNITYDFSLGNNEEDYWAHSVIYNGILGHQTPNGLDPVFYKTYNNAKNGTSEFKANELYWYYDPRYSKDLSWKKKDGNGNEIIIKETNKEKYKKLLEDGFKPTSPWYEAMASKFNYDKKKIAQELECSFLGSGNNFIDEENIKRIEDTQIKDPIRMEYDDFFWIWEDPIKDSSYVMTVDVSTGAGDDYSTIIILKRHETHLEQVAEFKHKVSPDTLGVIANDYGLRYNNAYAIVDITGGIGAMTMKTMLELGYNNVHYSVSRHEPTKEKLTDYVKEDENGKSMVPGFVISTSNRGMILTEMKRAIEANEVELKSYRLISEFKTFITTTNSRVADHRRSFNDDLVIALAMGIYVFSYDIKSIGMSVERTKKMLEAITNTVTDNNTGNSNSTNGNYNINPSNPYAAHSWLFKGLNK
jgi:hypothetical protein